MYMYRKARSKISRFGGQNIFLGEGQVLVVSKLWSKNDNFKSPNARIGNLLLCADLKVLIHSEFQEHMYFYTSQGQYTFCVNQNKIDM